MQADALLAAGDLHGAATWRMIIKTLRITPAMAAGVTDTVWDVKDIVRVIDEAEPEPKKRGPYKKRRT